MNELHSYESLHASVNDYYSSKLRLYGTTPKGVDWNDKEGQALRFEKLLSKLNISNTDSLLDYGCGYGALLDFLLDKNFSLSYFGCDLSRDMIAAAKEKHPGYGERFFLSSQNFDSFSFIVLSGVFNVKGRLSNSEWASYTINTIQNLLNKTEKGLSFNLLSDHSTRLQKRDDLFYGNSFGILKEMKIDPKFLVITDHSYSEWEFTVTIAK